MRTLSFTVLVLVLVGCGTALPTVGAEDPPKPGPETLLPATLDPRLREQAAAVVGNAPSRDKAIAELRRLKLQAIPYLLEVFLGADDMPRIEVLKVLDDLWMVRGLFGSSFDTKATDLLLEALTSPNVELRRGAATALFYAISDQKKSERILSALTSARKSDENAKVRAQAHKILGFLATSVVQEMFAPGTTTQDKFSKLESRFQTLEAIGTPALTLLEKALAGTQEDLTEIENLERIRRGIGAVEPNPETLAVVRYLLAWQDRARTTMSAIRANEKK